MVSPLVGHTEDPATRMVRAVTRRDYDGLRLMLQSGYNANGVSEQLMHGAPLYRAAVTGQPHMIRLLLNFGAHWERLDRRLLMVLSNDIREYEWVRKELSPWLPAITRAMIQPTPACVPSGTF